MSEPVVSSNSTLNRTVEKVVVNTALATVLYFMVGRPLLKKFGLIEDKAALEERLRQEALERSIKPDSTPISAEIDYGTFKAYADKQVFAKYNNTRIRSKGNSAAAVLRAIDTGQSAGYFYSVVVETLGATTKTWVLLTTSPNGAFSGFVPFSDIFKAN